MPRNAALPRSRARSSLSLSLFPDLPLPALYPSTDPPTSFRLAVSPSSRVPPLPLHASLECLSSCAFLSSSLPISLPPFYTASLPTLPPRSLLHPRLDTGPPLSRVLRTSRDPAEELASGTWTTAFGNARTRTGLLLLRLPVASRSRSGDARPQTTPTPSDGRCVGVGVKSARRRASSPRSVPTPLGRGTAEKKTATEEKVGEERSEKAEGSTGTEKRGEREREWAERTDEGRRIAEEGGEEAGGACGTRFGGGKGDRGEEGFPSR